MASQLFFHLYMYMNSIKVRGSVINSVIKLNVYTTICSTCTRRNIVYIYVPTITTTVY